MGIGWNLTINIDFENREILLQIERKVLMKNVLTMFILASMVFIFSNTVMAYNEFDLYLDYLHSGRTEAAGDSTDYNLIAVGVNYLSDQNFLIGAEFGFGSSAAYNGGPKTSQDFTNLITVSNLGVDFQYFY